MAGDVVGAIAPVVDGAMANRLKMLKRQMYGRAKFDRLSQHVLLAS